MSARRRLPETRGEIESPFDGFAGDVNDDGLDDLIVGAQNHDSVLRDEGAAFVYLLGLISGVPALAVPVRALLIVFLLGSSLLALRLRSRREKVI